MSKKVYIAIFLLAILIVATAAIIYATQILTPSVKAAVPGVNVGDTFTYSLKGASKLIGPDAVTPDYFYQFNETDYYKVTITAVNGSVVSFDTVWRFTNGTEIQKAQKVDVSTGFDSQEFWAIYASNLNKNDLLRPNGNDGLIVNSTDSRAYANSNRETNYWSIENQFFNINDPTYSTQRYDYLNVFFDKQTGILVNLNNVQQYNNPQMNTIITWKLTNSTAWDV